MNFYTKLIFCLQSEFPSTKHELAQETCSLTVTVTVTVTVTDNLVRYSSYRKAPPFPISTWTVMSTCLELPYMKCCPRSSLHVIVIALHGSRGLVV
jgi:hypothetical protein